MIGKTISHYHNLEEIDRFMMGAVYKMFSYTQK